MPLVMGLDAAWTVNGSSGVALVDTDHRLPRVVAVAPGYRAFSQHRRGDPVDWIAKPAGGEPALKELLNTAEQLAGRPVDVIVVDMPLSHAPITGRRTADKAISQVFGGRGCSTHSPSGERPGRISDTLRASADRLGYPLITTSAEPSSKTLIETYPHPAILHLTGATYRVPYKVQKIRKYWPDLPAAGRRAAVALHLSFVLSHLKAVLSAIDLDIDATAPVRRLKAVEDAIDALVCCWVGARWLDGAADAFGDASAAIWVPHPQHGREA
jgi:predicted RNase H-like nuclease